MGFENPTPIQAEAFNVVASGKDVVGIAQTGTGKTFAYMLPILRHLKYSTQDNPRVLILVPTRELVVQVVDEIEKNLALFTFEKSEVIPQYTFWVYKRGDSSYRWYYFFQMWIDS